MTVNGGWELSNTLNLPSLQKEYIGGANGFYVANSAGGWGPKMNSEDVYYDNVGNFLGTGFMQKYDISISGGNEKYSAYASANFMDNEGVVPKDYKKRLGVFVKGEFNPSKAMKIMLSANFIDSKARGFGNSMSTIYGWSINRDMADYKLDNGLPNWGNRYDDWDILTNSQRVGATLSPYYGRYMDKSLTESSRIIINGSIQWEPVKNLTFTGKVNYDKGWSSYESSTVPRYTTAGTEFIFDPVYDDEGNQIGTEFPSAIKQAYDERMGTYTFQPSRSERATTCDREDVFDRHQEGFVDIAGRQGNPCVHCVHEFHNLSFPLGFAVEGAEGRTADDGGVVAIILVLVEKFAHIHFHEFEHFLVVHHVALVQVHDDAGNVHLAGQEDVLTGLGHRAVSSSHNDDCAVHLGSTSYHVLNVVGVSRAVYVCIVAVLGFVFNVSGVDGDTTLFFLGGIVDLVEGLNLGETGFGQHCGDGGGQGSFTVVHVTNGTDVYMRFGSFEFLFCHNLVLVFCYKCFVLNNRPR